MEQNVEMLSTGTVSRLQSAYAFREPPREREFRIELRFEMLNLHNAEIF